jgi:hypothetical protein
MLFLNYLNMTLICSSPRVDASSVIMLFIVLTFVLSVAMASGSANVY